jgi:hypothetical protein
LKNFLLIQQINKVTWGSDIQDGLLMALLTKLILIHTSSNSGEITLVHNGIIENYDSIKKILTQKGYVFHSGHRLRSFSEFN